MIPERFSFLLIGGLAAMPLWADEIVPSTGTPSVAVTGETKSAPAPQAMTDRSGNPIFVTLTRDALESSELSSSVNSVTPEDFRAFAARNAGEALLHQASVQTLPIGELGSPRSARIRGSTPNQTLVLIDGRPVAGAALGSQDLSEIPTEQIDHIEILRGGASALYGPNAMGGVINVISKRAAYTGYPISHVGMEAGGHGRQLYRVDFGSRQGPVDFFFFGNRQWESGFRENSDASTYNVGGNAGLSMGHAGKLLLDAATYHANAGLPGQLTPAAPAIPDTRQLTDSQYLRTSYLLPLPHDSLMAMRVFGSNREVQGMDPALNISTDRHEQSRGADTQFNLPWGFVAGGSFTHDREDNTNQVISTNTYIRSEENWGFFAENTFRYDRFTLIPSGRFDHNSQAGDSKNPRVQTMFDAWSWLRLSASAARSFRVATIDEAQLNPLLHPEHAWTYDAGFEVHPASYSFRATYFRANVTDLIETTSLTTAANVGTARREGFEAEISHIVNEYFRDAWNYTYLQNHGMPSGFTNNVTLANSPKHTVNFLATITPTERWKIEPTVRYVSSRFSNESDPVGTAMGSMVLFDLRLSYQWRQLEVYIGVNNIADHRYEEVSGFPLAGRTTYGGLSLRLWG